MNKFTIAAVALIVASALPLAQAQAETTANSNASTQATSAAANLGNNQAVTFQSAAIPDHTTVRTAPAVGGNGYYGSWSSDACMVSAGAGVSVVGFGVQGATPIRDEQCAALRGVERTMQVAASVAGSNPGLSHHLQQAAVDILCTYNQTVGNALRAQGVCTVQAKPATQASAAPVTPVASTAQYTGNDPIVRRRLGMK